MSLYVAKIIETIPKERYFIAVDDGLCTGKELSAALANNLGCGIFEEMHLKKAMLQDDFDNLTLNLRFTRTELDKPVEMVNS